MECSSGGGPIPSTGEMPSLLVRGGATAEACRPVIQHFQLETEVDVITAAEDADVRDFITQQEVVDEGFKGRWARLVRWASTREKMHTVDHLQAIWYCHEGSLDSGRDHSGRPGRVPRARHRYNQLVRCHLFRGVHFVCCFRCHLHHCGLVLEGYIACGSQRFRHDGPAAS